MGWDDTAWRDIGDGVEITEVTAGSPPVVTGLVERHFCGEGGYQHVGSLPYGPPGVASPRWQVVQADPLTIVPSVLCPQCGLHGWITDGKWVPA